MEQSPSWETNKFSASQEISRFLWNPKVHYRIHNFPPPVYSYTAQSIPYPYIPLLEDPPIMLPSMPGSSKCPLFLRFSHQKPENASSLLHTRYMPPSDSSHSLDNIYLSTGLSSILGRGKRFFFPISKKACPTQGATWTRIYWLPAYFTGESGWIYRSTPVFLHGTDRDAVLLVSLFLNF
jgi:hypothetical protein